MKKISLIFLSLSLLGIVPVTTVEADLGTDLDPLIGTAHIRVIVVDGPGGGGIPDVEINITDPAIYSDCDGCGNLTNDQGEILLTLTGVPGSAIQITVEASGVAGLPPTSATIFVVAFATVDLEIMPNRYLTVYGNGDGNGTVTSTPGGINCTINAGSTSGVCRQSFDWDIDVTLSANPSAGSAFTEWSLDCSGSGLCTVAMDTYPVVYATFIEICTDLGGDTDGDEICGDLDNCPAITNPEQNDSDGDEAGDPCDNCPGMVNPEQSDFNSNGIGDACECEGDFEPDGECDDTDLLIFLADFGRTYHSGDMQGDFDFDGDCDGSDFSLFAADYGRTDCLRPPNLIFPLSGHVADNGCSDYSNPIEWNFYWSSLPNATKYHIYSIGPGAQIPLIDEIVNTNTYNFIHYGYIPNTGRFNWAWKVRSGNDKGQWSEWSVNSYFDVELYNTDCP